MPPSPTITAGARVTYQGDEYRVRSVDGNVLELAYDTGGFFRLVHVSSVTVCPTPATQTVASLPAPAAGQGKGITLLWFLATSAAALFVAVVISVSLATVLGIA